MFTTLYFEANYMIDINTYGPDYGQVQPNSVAEGLFRIAWSALDVLSLHDAVDAKVDILVGTKRMEGKFLDENIGGYCSAFEDDGRFEVDIELARLKDVETMYLNLCHEIIHMKQYVLHELGTKFEFLPDEVNITSAWKGKPWVAAKNQDGYFDSPWEKEAYEREQWLYDSAVDNLTTNINRRKR